MTHTAELIADDPIWLVLIKVVAIFAFLVLMTLLTIWAERRVLGRMQHRPGPNRAGPFGILQSLADGLKLALNVGAMLFAFVSLIALLNLILGALGGLFGLPEITFEGLIGYVFAPLMWVIGVPWSEAVAAGGFVGQKLVLNEFVAFTDFGPQAASFDPHTAIIITFALTGFANFSSLAILLGGLGGLVPSRRSLIAQYGMRAIAGGTLANLLSAAIAGMLV